MATRTAPLMLLCNMLGVGHYTIYSSNFIDWALSRGMAALYLGHSLALNALRDRYRDESRVTCLELKDWWPGDAGESLPIGDREILETLFFEQGISRQIEAISAVQRAYSPTYTLLVNSDDMLCHSSRFHCERNLFHSPVHGICIYGFRDHYLGFADAYTCRLNRLSPRQANFAGVFSLNEYHVAFRDPDQSFLHFLPDPYRAFEAGAPCTLSQADQDQLLLLDAFLSSDDRPLVPLLGVFNDRKNDLWVLEEVLRDRDLACVILGKRQPAPAQDARIDAVLDELRAQSRLFSIFEFVPELFFDRVLKNIRVSWVPLPYRTHYGSSGLLFQALEAGLPAVVPDVGLMARRCADHDLGVLFSHGDQDSFRAAFRSMRKQCLRLGQRGQRFMEHFSLRALYEALDYAFGLSAIPPALPCRAPLSETARHFVPPPWFASMLAGQEAHDAGDYAAAMASFAQGLAAANGDHAGLLFRQALSATLAGDDVQAAALLAWNQQTANVDEQIYSLRLLLESARFHASHNEAELAECLTAFCKGLVDSLHPVRADHLRSVGGMQAAFGRYPEAVAAFQAALTLVPDFHDVRLNLSDVLRYAGRYEEALAVLLELESLAPAWPQLHLKRGQVYFAQGQTGAALEEYALERQQGLVNGLLERCEAQARSASMNQ